MTTPVKTRIARPAARILLIDRKGRVLLFRYDVPDRPPFWCTPGGRVDDGESYEQAARRELFEETGLQLDVGPEVARRRAEFTALEGHAVWADERYFRVVCESLEISTAGHTEQERIFVTEHRWWMLDQLRETRQTVFPDDLADLVEASLIAAEDADAR